MNHDICVKVYLSADEFVALRGLAEEEGESESGFMRRLLRAAIRRYAHDAMAMVQGDSTTTGSDRA